MRLVFFGIANPLVNASQVKLYHFARGAADAGHDVTIIVPDDPVNLDYPAIRGSKITFRTYKRGSAIGEAWAKIWRGATGRFDLVHVVGIGLRSLNLFGRPSKLPLYVQDYDELMVSQVDHSRARYLYYYVLEGLTRQRAHAIVVASRALERYVRRRRPDLGNRLLYLPVGYDPSFEGSGRDLDSKFKEQIGERPVLTWMGGFWAAYGVYELLDLATVLARRSVDFVLVMVGDGPEREAVRQAVAQRQLSGHVLLPGRISMAALQAHSRISQVFLLPFPDTPQNRYRCPTKLFQYIAHNRPIVTNRVGEVAEALGDAGFYYRERDVEGMADACVQALAAKDGYDRSELIPSIYWSERARRYASWVESLGSGA